MKVTCVKCSAEKLVRKEVFEIRVSKVMAAKNLSHDEAVTELNATYLCRDCRPKAVKPVKQPKAKKVKAPKVSKRQAQPAPEAVTV